MPSMDARRASSEPTWLRKGTPVAVLAAAGLLVMAWCTPVLGGPSWLLLSSAALSALLAGSAYALLSRSKAGRLLGFGPKYVQVRSLDEWTLYQYGLVFDEASPEQQEEALAHYRVGLRLFPARPQDRAQTQSVWQKLLALLTLLAIITLSASLHGVLQYVIVLVYYGWIWGCMRIAGRFLNAPASDSPTGLHLE